MINRKTYKLTLGRQLSILSFFLIFNTIAIILAIRIFDWSTATYFMIGFTLVVSILPTIAVYLQYLKCNWNLVFTVDTDKKSLEYKVGDIIIEKSFTDVSRLIKTSAFSGRYSFADYRYYTIIYTDNSNQVLTCLLIPDIEKNLRDQLIVNEEQEFKFLPLI